MYLQCPRCHSLFEIAAEAIGAKGRKVNCAVCSNIWAAKKDSLIEKMPAPAKNNEPAFAEQPTIATAFSSPNDATSIAPPEPNLAQAQKNTAKSKRKRKTDGNLSDSPAGKEREQKAVIPPPQLGESEKLVAGNAAAALQAHTHHLHFAPLQFAERNIERRVNELIRFTISWVIWALFIAAIVYAVRVYPIEIIKKIPNSVHLYERLNLMQPAFAKLMLPVRNYSIGKVNVTNEFRLSRDILLVTTSVANKTKNTLETPILRGSFRNARDEEISYFHFRAIEEEIPPEKAIEYRINVEKPDPSSETLLITLISSFEASLDIGGSRLEARVAAKP